MAGKKIQGGTVHVDGKANLKDIINESKKAGKSVDKLGRSAHSADRNLKGAAQASSNTTKNFSKMAQGISGGLVPAYATLAANLFALDAVFRFLKDAGDFRVLKEGQLAFAAATGVAYQSLARDLQAATQNMISFRDAAQAGAIGRAAGLSAGQLNQLSEAAFKVSVALGRDVTDSFNRLIRGVTKAEPELLDELGIVLRLEEATTKYAAALGLNKNQLSIYQKSQAVVNEVLDQTERKFGKIDAIMNPQANALAQLGIAFEEVIDQIKLFIAPFAEGIGKFMTNNIDVITVAIIGFGAGIINSVIPSVDSLREAQSNMTLKHEAELERLELQYDELILKKQALAGVPIAQQNLVAANERAGIEFGGKTGADLKAGKALSGQQIGNLKSQLGLGGGKRGPIGVFKDMSLAQRKEYEGLFNDMKKNGGKVTKQMALQFEELGIKWGQTTNEMKTGWMKFSGAIQTGSRVILSVFARIGTFFAIGSMIYVGIKALISFFNKDTEARLKAYNDKLQPAIKSQERFNVELNKMAEVRRKGLLTSLAEEVTHTGEAVASANLPGLIETFNRMAADADVNREAFNEFQGQVQFTFNRLAELDEGFKSIAEEFRKTGDISDTLAEKIRELNEVLLENNAAMKTITESEGELIKAQNRLTQNLPKTQFQDIVEILNSMNNAYDDLNKNTEAFGEEQAVIVAQLEVYNSLLASSLRLEQRAARVKMAGSFKGMMTSTSQQRTVALENKRIAIAKTLNELNGISVMLSTTGVDLESARGQEMQKQLDLKKLQLAQLALELDLLTLTSDKGFQLVDTLYQGLQKDLGSAISGALRGEDNAFENLGKNFSKAITDSIGDFLAEQFMEDVFKDALGIEDVKDKIMLGAEYHAFLVQQAIEMGGDAHATVLGQKIAEKGINTGLNSHAGAVEQVMATGNAELSQQLKNISTSNINLFDKKIKETEAKIDQIDKDIIAKTQFTYEGGINKYVEGIGTDSKSTSSFLDFLHNRLDPDEAVKLQTQKDLKEGLFRDLEKVRGGGSYIVPTSFDGTAEDYIMSGIKQANFEIGNILGGGKGGRYDDAGVGSYSFTNQSGDRLLEEFRKFLIEGIEDAKIEINQMESQRGRHEMSIAGFGVEKAGHEARLEFLNAQTSEEKTKSILGTGTDTAEVGLFNKDGTLNQEYLANFSGTIDELFEEFKKKRDENKDKNETNIDKFSKGLNQFSGVIGMMGALTGKEEQTAKIMAKVAQIQLLVATYERAKMALEQGGGNFFATIGAFMFGEGARQGGIMSKHGRSYSDGGIASGPNSGYGAILHGREAVIPLPNGRSIPVDMGKGQMATNNTNITVNIDDSGSSTNVDGEGAKELGNLINASVQATIEKEMRPGGILSGG